MSSSDIQLGPTSSSREIQMHTDALIRLDGAVDDGQPRDPAGDGRMCQTFERDTDDDLVWRPPLLIVIAALLVWVWIIFEIYQVVHAPQAPDTAPGLFE